MARGARDSAGHPGREGRHPGPHRQVGEHEPGHAWWQVVCLTGVDYFSTIGYQPAIAFLAAGLVSPLATIVLILVTLFRALPVYRRVAAESPYGEGSLAMLERILAWWSGKILVLVLLGFAATDFLITMTLSAPDASTHLLENPYAPHFVHGHQFVVTLVLLAALAAVFLRGFGEAIGIAVVLVAFPKLALGLSGFETGVLVMPQWRTEKARPKNGWPGASPVPAGCCRWPPRS